MLPSETLQTMLPEKQRNSKMTIQNRVKFDVILLKEKGVSGKILLSVGDCCVHIPNVSVSLHEEMNKRKKTARDNREIAAALVTNQLGAVLSVLGFSCQLAN